MKKYVVYTKDNPCIGYFEHSELDTVKSYIKWLKDIEAVIAEYKEVDDYTPENDNYFDDFGAIQEMCK